MHACLGRSARCSVLGELCGNLWCSQEYTHDWTDRHKLLRAVAHVVRTAAPGGIAHRCVTPFNALVYPLAAPLALLVARSAGAHLLATSPRAHPPLRPAPLGRAGGGGGGGGAAAVVRIAYLSSELSDNSVGREVEAVVRAHDPRRFRASCYAMNDLGDAGASKATRAWRARIGRACAGGMHTPPRGTPAKDVAARLNAEGVHVVHDRRGGARRGGALVGRFRV